jgi:hypothetical protein
VNAAAASGENAAFLAAAPRGFFIHCRVGLQPGGGAWRGRQAQRGEERDDDRPGVVHGIAYVLRGQML